jgi:hypothetical protein
MALVQAADDQRLWAHFGLAEETMRTRMAWALAAVAALSVGTSASRAGDDSTTPQYGWTGPFKDWNKPTPEPAPKKKPTPKPPETVAPETASSRFQEEANLLRWLAVCDKLREVADHTNDQELMRRADQLEDQANKVYAERTALLARTGAKARNGATTQVASDRNKLLDAKDSGSSVAAKGVGP